MRHKHIAQHHKQGQDKSPQVRLEATHPICDREENKGEEELHGEVSDDPGSEIRRQCVHAGAALFREHGTVLGEGEYGVEGGENTPKDGDEEEKAKAILDVMVAGVPPHEAGEERGGKDLEDAEGIEGFVFSFFEASLEENGELVEPVR